MAIERRTFVIGAVAGGIGLVEYGVITGWMNSLSAPRGFSVKDFASLGEQAALLAITPNEDFVRHLKRDYANPQSRRMEAENRWLGGETL